MTKFLPLQVKDLGSWRCTEGHQTESHGIILFLPAGGFLIIHVAYVKISFVTVAKVSIFTCVNGESNMSVTTCSRFQVNKDNMGMTCDEMTMEWTETNKLLVTLKGKTLGAQGSFELAMNNQNSYQLDPTIHGDSTIHYMLTEPLSGSGRLNINKQDIEFQGTTGYHLHTTFPGRFDGVYKHSYVSVFDSPNHKVVSIMHQPCSPTNAPLIQQIYIHGTTTTVSTSVNLKIYEQYEDAQLHHILPKTITLEFPDVDWSLDTTDLKPSARIDALEHVPYIARKLVNKIMPSPCFYLHYTKATLTTPESKIEGQFYFEKAQF